MGPPTQLVKASDEGSTSPFIARIFFGILSFRDQLYLLGVPEQERHTAMRTFDASFKPLLEAAQASRDAAREVLGLVSTHAAAIMSGQAVRFRPNQYEILDNIDTPLSQAFDKLVDQSIIATKGALQPLLRDRLELNIGYFFQKDSPYSRGAAAMRGRGETALATYLDVARSTWHSHLQDLRSKHEHEGWALPGLRYTLIAEQSVTLGIPKVHNLPVHEFARATANRTLRFIEDLVLHAMIRRCRYPIFLVESPPAERNPMSPERFRLAPKGLDPSPPWEIYYSDTDVFV